MNRYFRVLAIAISIANASCIFPEVGHYAHTQWGGLLTVQEEQQIEEAIKENQAEIVQDILSHKAASQFHGPIKGAFGVRLLDLALNSKQLCKPQVVEAILAKEAMPQSSHIISSASIPCPDASYQLALKLSPNQLAEATHASMQGYLKLTQVEYPPPFKELEIRAKMLRKLLDLNRVNCSKLDEDHIICKHTTASENLAKQAIQNYKNYLVREEYKHSPEGIKYRACQIYASIRSNNAVIDRENNIGELSGFIDKRTLYTAGELIFDNYSRLNVLIDVYKHKTGKVLDLKNCPST